jgi:hypothetical protein
LRNAETGVVGVFLRSAVMNSFWSADAVAYAGAIDIENIVKGPDAAVYSASRWLAMRAVGGELSPLVGPGDCRRKPCGSTLANLNVAECRDRAFWPGRKP